MNVIYYIMTHKNERQIMRLIGHLQSSENSFILIHHDAKSKRLDLPSRDNIHVLDDPLEVRWGDISQVHAMYKAITWVKKERFPFDWMIFLSGQDYPVRPLSEIESELRHTNFDAYLNYQHIHEDPAQNQYSFRRACYQRYFMRKIRIPKLRPIFLKRKHPYVNGLKCFAGSSWTNLSCAAVEHLWSRKDLVDMLIQYLHNASCPDETVFHTVLMHKSNLRFNNTEKRFIVWQGNASHPEILGTQHLDMITSSDAWFARKVDDAIHPELLNQLDSIIHRHHSTTNRLTSIVSPT